MPEVLVLDASAAVNLLVTGQGDTLGADGVVIVAPSHLDAEVLSALGRLHRQQVLTEADVDEMLNDLVALAVQRVPVTTMCADAFELRHNVSLPDALYVATARSYRAALVTADLRLAAACEQFQLCRVRTT